MYLKLSEKVTNSLFQINLIDDGYEIALELSLFAFNIKKRSLWCFRISPFFEKNLKKNAQHVF
jgi:hypothetical protein